MSFRGRVLAVVRPTVRRCDWCGRTYAVAESTSGTPRRFCAEACAVEDQALMTP